MATVSDERDVTLSSPLNQVRLLLLITGVVNLVTGFELDSGSGALRVAVIALGAAGVLVAGRIHRGNATLGLIAALCVAYVVVRIWELTRHADLLTGLGLLLPVAVAWRLRAAEVRHEIGTRSGASPGRTR